MWEWWYGCNRSVASGFFFCFVFFCMNVLWLFKQVNFMQMWPLLAMAEFTNSRRWKGQMNTVEHFSADYYSCKCLCGMSCTALACDTLTPQSGCTTVFLFQRALFYTSQSFLFSLSKIGFSLNKMAVFFFGRPQSNLKYTLSPHTDTQFLSLWWYNKMIYCCCCFFLHLL